MFENKAKISILEAFSLREEVVSWGKEFFSVGPKVGEVLPSCWISRTKGL